MTEQEKRLVEGCLKGDKVFQKKLYNTYASKMYNVCLRYSNGTEQARDLLQEGFIRVFQNLHTFKGEGSFEGWVRRIMVNGCLESLRKAENKFIHEDIQEMEAEFTASQPELRQYDLQFVLGKIQQLAPGYRAVFNLYVLEGYQHHEIGEMLGISESTSKSQLSRARKILQDLLTTQKTRLNG